MHYILQLGERLFIDLENGRCGNTPHLASAGTGEKLTHGQLRILSYLVENREHVCGIGTLQGLFDGSLGEEQVAGIKQQLQRIKNKLRSVDDTFDRRRAKDVFQAVQGVGYRFHLPEGGEILEMAAPSDALHRLDARWMESIRRMADEEKAAVRMRFDRMDSSWENTLRASALGMVVHGTDMRRQLRAFSDFVFLEYGSSGVVTMTSVGAEGKTVLLAEFARMCIEEHPNWNVYEVDLSRMESSREAARGIMEYIRREGIGKIHRTILLLDSTDLLSSQFAYFLEQVLVTDQPWLYVVIADRLFSFTLAFEQPWLRDYREYMRVYMLDPQYREMTLEEKAARKAKEEALMESRTFYIRGADGKKREIDRKELEQAARRREQRIARRQLATAPSIEMKKEVMAGIVKRCFSPWKHVREELMEYLEDVPYERRSYVDLYLMLLGKAGREEESGRQEIMELCACRGNAVWDDWAFAMRILDHKCEGEWIISEMFPIMAAMWIFGIRVTLEFLCRVTGKENFGNLRWILNESTGNTICVEKGRLLAPDMDMLYAYFYLHPKITPEGCLRCLFGYPWMDAEMLVEATRKTFVHFMHNRSESIPFSVDMLQLAGLAKKNHTYSRFYAEKELADIPELGVLWYSHLPDFSRGKLSGTTIAFTTAFERVVDKEPPRRVCIQYWLRFLEVAAYYFEDVPDFLMNFYLDSYKELRENMIAGVENSLHNGQYFLEKMWQERMEHYLLELRKAETADHELANADGNENTDRIANGILDEDAENKLINADSNETIKGNAGENAKDNTKEDTKENAERTISRDRILQTLLRKRQDQLRYLATVAAQEKEFFEMFRADSRGEEQAGQTAASISVEAAQARQDKMPAGQDEVRTGEEAISDTDREIVLVDLSVRMNRILMEYRDFRDAMAQTGEDEGVLLVTGRWSMFCYRVGLYREAQEVLQYALRTLPKEVEGIYWIYMMMGKIAETGRPSVPGEPSKNPCYNLEAAEKYYREGYENYLQYGNQNDLEPFSTFLQMLARLYNRQGRKKEEDDIYREMETRIPAARIRREIQGEKDQK